MKSNTYGKNSRHLNSSIRTHQHFVINQNADCSFYHNEAPCGCICQGIENLNALNWYARSTVGIERETIVRAYKAGKRFRWNPQYTSPVEKAFLDLQSRELKESFVHNFKLEWKEGKYYYIDYALPTEKIGIEIDEEFHKQKLNRLLDEVRQKTIENLGWTILRVPQTKLRTVMSEITGMVLHL